MRTWRRFVVALFVLGTGFLFYRWWTNASERGSRRAPSTDEPSGVDAPASTGASSSGPSPGPVLDRTKADRMREEIRALLAEAGAPSGASGAAYPSMPVVPEADGRGTKVDPEYLQRIIARDFVPLARSCYDGALAKNPALSGKAVVRFEILGDRKVGGVVSDAKLVDGTTIEDLSFRTCVTESMMSLSFDAPPEDGTLSVTVPMRFSPTRLDGGSGD
jgi:hypothetical protein